MFYSGVDDNGEQRIGLATSSDLVTWAQGDSVFQATQAGDWVDRAPPGYGGDAQLRDAFVMEAHPLCEHG